MTRLLLRFGPAVVALVFVWISWGSWTFGDPPTHTTFGPRAEAVVVTSTVESGHVNGSIRHTPVVSVRWPSEDGDVTPLGGLVPAFFAYDPFSAMEIAGDFTPGSRVSVRVYEGAPFADHLNLFGLAHAGFMSLFSLVLLVIAWLAFAIFKPDQATR